MHGTQELEATQYTVAIYIHIYVHKKIINLLLLDYREGSSS